MPTGVEKHPTLADANLIVSAAVGKAQELNLQICVAVCNQLGWVIALNRMDGAFEQTEVREESIEVGEGWYQPSSQAKLNRLC
jgi:hypothetical protein